MAATPDPPRPGAISCAPTASAARCSICPLTDSRSFGNGLTSLTGVDSAPRVFSWRSPLG